MSIDVVSANCSQCGTGSVKGYDVPGIRFWTLEGSPLICEKCIYKKLSGESRDWKNDIEPYLKDK